MHCVCCSALKCLKLFGETWLYLYHIKYFISLLLLSLYIGLNVTPSARVEVAAQTSVTLECISLVPNISVLWTYRQFSSFDPTLNLSSVSVEDSGFYDCEIASNQEYPENATSFIQVSLFVYPSNDSIINQYSIQKGCGNIDQITRVTRHFDIFSSLLFCSPCTLYTVHTYMYFQFTGHSLDLSVNVLHHWVFPHH